MEFPDLAAILAIILGNGAVIALIEIYFKHSEHKSGLDFEARKEAKEYYMTLYAHIAVLDELAMGYHESTKNGKDGTAKVFSFTSNTCNERNSQTILNEFKLAYSAFSSYYIKNKSKGYEIFVSQKLAKALITFWVYAQTFDEDGNTLKDKKKIDDFHKTAKKLAQRMSKLFGLK